MKNKELLGFIVEQHYIFGRCEYEYKDWFTFKASSGANGANFNTT